MLRLLTRFVADESGNFAVTAAALVVTLTGFAGAAVDYSAATMKRQSLQAVADAAAIAAATNYTGSPADRRKTAENYVLNNGNVQALLSNVDVTVKEITNGVQVSISGQMPTRLVKVVGINSMTVQAFSEAGMGSGNQAEIALVLDNTGSMYNDMPALKTAAKQFVDIVFASGKNNVKMSVVPYVAAVNVGNGFPRKYMDVNADSAWHGATLANAWSNYMGGCDPCPGCTTGGGGGGGGGDPGPGSPGGNDKRSEIDLMSGAARFASVLDELLGIKAARADVTPSTSPPVPGALYSPGSPYVTDGSKAFLPTNWSTASNCWLVNPPKISHFDLFNRMGNGVAWKGCVEARPEPYDVTDDPPVAGDPNTLFVPYFWASEPNVSWSGQTYDNSYMDDALGKVPSGWVDTSDWGRVFNLFKYNGDKPLSPAKETGPLTTGPNASCPDELQTLTTTKGQVVSKIENLGYWSGGGTISSEGIMWGWRTLSPNPPFAMGAPYASTTKKYIVLMSDGMNSLVANNPSTGVRVSDYTAYAYLTTGRFPTQTFPASETYLNNRMLQACTNAKAKGIVIYTILFRETNSVAKQVMKDCATAEKNFVFAANQTDLQLAFNTIGRDISNLRLTR